MKSFVEYFKLMILAFITVLILRGIEFISIVLSFGMQQSLIGLEFKGLFFDLICLNFILVAVFPIYFLFNYSLGKSLNSLGFGLILLLTVFHLFILSYFLYQLEPLDAFLFKYDFKEVILTLKTTETKSTRALILIAVLIVSQFLGFRFLTKIEINKYTAIVSCGIMLLFFPVLFFADSFSSIQLNKYSANKSIFFYTRTATYFWGLNEQPDKIFTDEDALEYQQLFNSKQSVDLKYPLLHQLDTTNHLRNYFNKFETAPNLVILTVEGLSDDFIHAYKGVELMPFLSQLKTESLYWNRCFTLGERSFAVVPSLLGGLPYGEKGFTVQDKLPRHLSLIPILKRNGYYTSFFYGQGSWFHQKDRFFKSNDIDLIFDNSRFDESYSKIIVGDDQFFWGYNDKDLFSQSLAVLDTLTTKPRFDFYFTGTSHSPFQISEKERYEQRFLGLTNSLKSSEDVQFFEKYKKFIQSLLFVDDALSDFFQQYRQRSDFENTIFVITGDHPMTELPIANKLKSYHVPFIIYSPDLKTAKTFNNTVSHLDFYETIVPFLNDYISGLPTQSASLGTNFFDTNETRPFVFMNNNREIVDIYSNGYFLSSNQLYKADNGFSTAQVFDNDVEEKLDEMLTVFRLLNNYVCSEDRIVSESVFCDQINAQLIVGERADSVIAVENEYFTLVKSKPIAVEELTYAISFNFENVPDEQCQLVYEIAESTGEKVLWKSIQLKNGRDVFQSNIKIPELKNGSSQGYVFDAYIWNKGKTKFSISELRQLLYQRK